MRIEFKQLTLNSKLSKYTSSQP